MDNYPLWKFAKLTLIVLFDVFRLAVERDVEKGGALSVCNLVYDESGYFILYATMLGVKVVNLYNNRLVRTIGKPENLRLLNLALFQVSITCDEFIF